jgi:hypothetical protein
MGCNSLSYLCIVNKVTHPYNLTSQSENSPWTNYLLKDNASSAEEKGVLGLTPASPKEIRLFLVEMISRPKT